MSAFESSVLAEMAWRQRIEQVTHDELDQLLARESVVLYAGFDPTADSLHLGNLVPMMGLAFFQRHGHRPIALVGGATGRIGDPSGKSTERNLLSEEQLEHNLRGIERQLHTILARALDMHPETLGPHVARAHGWTVPLLNNYDWFKGWSFLDFLRDVGKHFRVNAMLAKDSVSKRLQERDQGISYTEFSYMLLQGYDFLHLLQAHDCKLQIGGSDQWGNITAGTELIRRKQAGASAFGLTMPLLTTASGQKFGKSEKGAIWLDPAQTSPYTLYQYWVQRPDEDVVTLLKTFTFLSKDEIDALAADIAQGRNQGQVQQTLAWEVTCLIHGEHEAQQAIKASKMLFGEPIEGLSDAELAAVFAEVPSSELPKSALEGEGALLVDLLAQYGVVASKGEARRLLQQGGGYVNNRRADAERRVTLADLVGSRSVVLRAGKKKYHLLQLT
jgi:tyrosyl-tRNA synthetase